MSYTQESFKEAFGTNPINDDLERVNCQEAGAVGHFQCGVCPDHNKPRFMCGCMKVGDQRWTKNA